MTTSKIEFLVKKIEGEIVSSSDQKGLIVFNAELKKYADKEKELNSLAYPNSGDFFNDMFGDDKPQIDVKKELENQGYSYQSGNGFQIFETPYSKIEIKELDKQITFNISDGVCLANEKITVNLK